MFIEMNTDSPDPEETWLYQFITEAMNINIEVTKLVGDNKSEKLSLAFASGELPDIIIGGGFSVSDLYKYGTVEGQLIDLAPYINETNMPNLTAMYEKNPDLKIPVTDAEGHVWSLGHIGDSDNNQQVMRAFINYDWLEECNLEVPATLDEFTNMLRTFKEMDDNIIPLGGSWSANNPGGYILNAFGYITNDPEGLDISLRNGEVVLPVADREAYGEYLKYMNMLYTEGLIHPDFFTMDGNTTNAIMTEGRNGWFRQAPFVYVEDYGAWWGAQPLTSEWNDTAQWPINPGAVRYGSVMITSACEDPELAAAFIDYFYKPADHFMESTAFMATAGPNLEYHSDYLYGVGGYKLESEGSHTRIFLDMEANSDKWPNANSYLFQTVRLWNVKVMGTSLTTDLGSDFEGIRPGVAELMAEYDVASDARHAFTSGQFQFETALSETVCKYITTEVFPSAVYFDGETQERMNNIQVVIEDYAVNETAKFITGARSLDELDEYFDEIERLGAKEYVQTYAEYYESIQ